jgi:hypothetical protein
MASSGCARRPAPYQSTHDGNSPTKAPKKIRDYEKREDRDERPIGAGESGL